MSRTTTNGYERRMSTKTKATDPISRPSPTEILINPHTKVVSAIPDTNADGTPWWFGLSRDAFTKAVTDQQPRMAGSRFGQVSGLGFNGSVVERRPGKKQDGDEL